MTKQMRLDLPATVGKIIRPSGLNDAEMVQICIQGGMGSLPSEIRIENCLTDKKGQVVKLQEGARVTVRVDAADSQVLINSTALHD